MSIRPLLPFITLIFYLATSAAGTATAVFNPRFKTLKVSSANGFMLNPVIRLNTDDRIIISFDEIADDRSYLQYKIIHCNADWQPSRLVESDYLDGFNIADVDDFGFSSATFIRYVNYRIEIPNSDMQPLVSGNYLLQVFDQYEPDDIILQARFSISENIAPIGASVSSRTDRGVNDQWQQLALSVNYGDLNINPYSDLIVTVEQNNVESSLTHLKAPMRTTRGSAIYEHAPELIFPAGNEYRRFETVRANYPGMGADSARFSGTNYHVFLTPDHVRADASYQYDQTQHGRFLVREYNATDSDLGADYVTVHFTLDAPRFDDSDIYVDGEMTHNRFDASNRMTYDPAAHSYSLQMPLKQGSYNYRYVALSRQRGGRPDASPVEGNFHETSNEYEIKAYLRLPGSRADRLIGTALISN